MALKRVTMQQIADACGLSRNTVSKVFNGRGSVPEATKNLVFSKARELGYYQYVSAEAAEPDHTGTIALLTQHKLLSHNFGAYFVTSFTDQISRAGYSIQVYEVPPSELEEKRLPPLLDVEKTAGFLGIELFDRAYIEMICTLGVPTVFVDGYPRASKALMQCDFVSMENITSEMILVGRMVDNGAKRLGFVGDIQHCNSFYERWLGFSAVLAQADIPIDRSLCILEKDSILYGDVDWVAEQLRSLPEIPDAFACANDYLAIHLIGALKKLGLSVPKDVMVTGFDGSPEAKLITPTLTTAKIPSTDIGKLAATLLIRRIQMPDFPYHWTNVKTTPIWGESTR